MIFKRWNYNSYVSEFLSLRCAGDVLNVVSPLGPKAQKEMTEAMGVIKCLRHIVLEEPMKYNILDLCAGNALVSIIAAHLLPIQKCFAVDKRERKREWQKVKKFSYQQADIYDNNFQYETPTIVVAIHPCKDLAERVIEIYQQRNLDHIILMPCCKGKIGPQCFFTKFEQAMFDSYEKWCVYLARKINANMYRDDKIKSPCNIIIWK